MLVLGTVSEATKQRKEPIGTDGGQVPPKVFFGTP